MVVGITLLAILLLVIGIWVFWELKRFKHKVFAIFLITVILFLYISMAVVFREQDIDFKTFSGINKATGLYFSFLGSMFGNLRTITTNAIRMDWRGSQNDSK
jgi:uncharacterized membrane protein YozB (DUF420 family)